MIRIAILVFLCTLCSSPKDEKNLNYRVIQREIEIDADITDWKGLEAETVKERDHLWIGQGMEIENWQGPADLSFKWRAARSGNSLYFLFEVSDDTISPFNRDNTWLNDCIEICIDPENRSGRRKDTIDGEISLRGYELHFLPSQPAHAYLNDERSPYFVAKPQDEIFKTRWNGEMAVRYTPNGYIMELAFTLPDIELVNGVELGIEMAVCDDDGNGRINLMTWTGIQADYWLSMDSYGSLVIGKALDPEGLH